MHTNTLVRSLHSSLCKSSVWLNLIRLVPHQQVRTEHHSQPERRRCIYVRYHVMWCVCVYVRLSVRMWGAVGVWYATRSDAFALPAELWTDTTNMPIHCISFLVGRRTSILLALYTPARAHNFTCTLVPSFCSKASACERTCVWAEGSTNTKLCDEVISVCACCNKIRISLYAFCQPGQNKTHLL